MKSISMWGFWGVALAVASTAWAAAPLAPDGQGRSGQRQSAARLMKDGNFKDAYDRYSALATDPTDDAQGVCTDLESAVSCLQKLGRIGEADAFREKVIQAQAGNWRLLWTAAKSYFELDHYGVIVGGKFMRGPNRSGTGRYVNTEERDRVRALQLMERARGRAGEAAAAPGTANAPSGYDVGALYMDLARMLVGYRGFDGAWRLQYLTDLSQLPDFDEGNRFGYGGQRGAPVDEAGNPVFHRVPARYEDAATDGERWRKSLESAAQADKNRLGETTYQFAQFLNNQFGVQTMADYGWAFSRAEDDDQAAGKTFAIHTLAGDETMARLATGIKRFRMPDEFNFLRLYRTLADGSKSGYSESAINDLAGIYENRRQYSLAAECWQRSIKDHGPGNDNWKQKRLDQILGNWGRFEPCATHPAGSEAEVGYRYRNARQVTFAAVEIDVRLLLADIKDYLKSNPRELEWDRLQLGNIGYSLVEKNQTKYLGKEAARWTVKLDPRPNHFDRIATVSTPLKKAGAYLLTATVEGGNTSRIVIWINDTVLVRKPMDQQAWFYVADAVTGEPVAKANVDFFGYRQDPVKSVGRHYNVLVSQFAELSDADGQVLPQAKDFDTRYSWLVTASTDAGRLAYLGFTGVWYGHYYDAEYNATKVYGITDRPVYRPDQPVRFKFWLRKAQYDQEDSSPYAGQAMAVIVKNPKGDKVFEKTYTADEFAGVNGEFTLPKDAALGQYYAYVWKDGASQGGVNFRVEEYKKPEFEVSVEAPTEPVMLGETIKATIKAKYYFGAPVKKGKVKYTVKRSGYRADWYPLGRWDWFYGPGYWWFASDCLWYPGWREWGCPAPLCWWWPVRQDPPELVAENEVPLGDDGTVAVTIDTSLAKELHGDIDHRYEIVAEVTDESRRTIVGQGAVLVARKPFKVYAWVDRGHYRVGDTVRAEFSAQTLDNKPVKGEGALTLYRVTYRNGEAIEVAVQNWRLDTDGEGHAAQPLAASQAGQYRLAYKVTDARRHTIEGGYLFLVRGDGFDGREFRFNEIELVSDRREYAPGDKVRLLVNVDKPGATVLLFVRPANGFYLPPKVLRVMGKSTVVELDVTKKDMPNFFVEAVTIYDGKLHTQMRELIVPPEKRVLNVDVRTSATTYKPGEQASIRLKVTDVLGKPYAGSLALSVYDKAVEYISGGSNVAEIKAFFWKWRRHHQPATESSLARQFGDLVKSGVAAMENVGVFGETSDDDLEAGGSECRWGTVVNGRASGVVRKMTRIGSGFGGGIGGGMANGMAVDAVLPMSAAAPSAAPMEESARARDALGDVQHAWGFDKDGTGAGPAEVQPVIRKEFADTAFWTGLLAADINGEATVTFKMPENLTGWKIRTWAMGHGTKVGEGTAEVVTAKNLLLRLQAPRFFVEKDEVVLSANIHNYLPTAKSVRAVLEMEGGCLEAIDKPDQTVRIAAGNEQRVDWRVRVVREGQAVVRMKALSDEESDAMEMRFPAYVHGMLKTDSFCGVIRPEGSNAAVTIMVPRERRVEQSVLEVRYSPTLAGALVDALPYLVDYPYGCTEQTLDRFLPTVLVQKTLKDMGVDLKTIRDKRTNLNAQEIGNDKERAAQWKRTNPPNPGVEERNPVFDEAVVTDMVKQGIKALTEMQVADGGWGWFSGFGEQSWPHTTAYVVHGLQVARLNGVAVPAGVTERGVAWLQKYQETELRKLRNAVGKHDPWKEYADDLDAFVYMVLVDAGNDNGAMRDFLYRDRTRLSVYAKAMFGLALVGHGQDEKLAMVLQSLQQYVIRDAENQTAYFNLGNQGYWWCWYGSENEAHAYYLKLLAKTDPKSADAAGLVKYLLNNRKHASYWNSTRDTALCIEGMAEYLKASGEDKPDMTVEILLDGRKVKEARITADTLFGFDNRLVLEGAAVEAGKHTLEVRRVGRGPVYFNAYLTNFTLEDPIAKAGLEIKVERRFYKLTPSRKTIKVAGGRGQALDQRVEKYDRTPLESGALLRSGDLVEVELEIASKNDYEYVVFEDMKPAGFEPVEVRSGYNGNDMGAYVEFHDERVCFFSRVLGRGAHSVTYRLRAEIPGSFSALPTRASAMYAPELKANSDEMKLGVKD